MTDTPIEHWADRLERAIENLSNLELDRVVVLGETVSTQDAAAAFGGKNRGILCIAGRQTGGRGRLGRLWADDCGRGVSLTIGCALRESGPHLPLAVGVAIAEAAATFGCQDRIGLRWPNDVVDRPSGKKIAGVLIERADGFTMIGIGVNVHQQQSAWDGADQPGAISLAQMGVEVDRLTMIEHLLQSVDARLGDPPERLAAEWARLDTLVGTEQVFIHNGEKISGLVESIDPTNELVVRSEAGGVRLPAATTSLVHGD